MSQASVAAKTFFVSVLGSVFYMLLQLPLPWILGPLTALLAAKSISAGPYYTPPVLRNLAFIITGIYFGTSFSRETLTAAVPFLLPYTLLTALLLTFSITSGLWLARRTGIDPVTGVFASIPGGLSEMVAASDSLKGNAGIVSVLQTIRILSVVFFIPFFVTYAIGSGESGPAGKTAAAVYPDSHPAAFTLYLLPIAAAYFLRKTLPAAYVVGSLFTSALVNISGMPIPHLPYWLAVGAQLIIGTSIGSKMSIQDLKKAGSAGPPFFIYTLLLITISLGMGVLFSYVTGIPLETGLLSMAPGGLVEMVLTAESIGGDPATVSSLQLIRFLFIVIAVPSFLKWMFKVTSRQD
ncbi:AbrB family transcriptional regulator [Metabacillus mangrovi]|nr:AbrB family transcriptional regulator [Metabacillus mangrovi]